LLRSAKHVVLGWVVFGAFMLNRKNVAIVVDPKFGGRLERLTARAPVWIVASEANKAVSDELWKAHPHKDHRETGAITTYPVSDDEDRRTNLLDVIADVEIHHGVGDGDYLVFPRDFALEVIGVHLDSEVKEALRGYGFISFTQTEDGFTAFKPK